MSDLQLVRDRSAFANQWLRSAQKQQDIGQVFSAFFSAYLALVVCATQVMGDAKSIPNGEDENWEKDAIEKAMNFKHKEIAIFLESENGVRIKQAIWQREIPENKNIHIIGPGNDVVLQQAALNLAAYFRPLRTSPLKQGIPT